MAQPRSLIVSTEITPYYHIISRCVRQSYLCGKNHESGQSFEHRRSWVEKRLLFLATVFTIDICAYGVLHNHYHVTVHVDLKKAQNLTDKEVIERWHKIYKGTPLSQKFLSAEPLSDSECDQLKLICKKWRIRLGNISWFMRCCNENIARRANKEDNCTGHFWSGRFKSIPILDYRALLATMVYNDLNPIKAGLANNIQESDFTSIKRRLTDKNNSGKATKGLMPFKEEQLPQSAHHLPFLFSEYLNVVEWTAIKYRTSTESTKEFSTPEIVNTLGLLTNQWTEAVINFEQNFKGIIGTSKNVEFLCKHLNLQWMHGLSRCRRCFDSIHQNSNPLMSMMLAKNPINHI